MGADEPGAGSRIPEQLGRALRDDPEAIRLDLPDLVDLMLGTGVRIGEACATRWSAINLDAGTFTVEATVIRSPGQGLTLQNFPKSAAGERTIALPRQISQLLRDRPAAAPSSQDLVFPTATGGLRDPSNTSGALRRALDRAGFGSVISHTFRKTVATRLDEAGLSARQIADQLGHNRPSLTQDVYLGRGIADTRAAIVLDDTL